MTVLGNEVRGVSQEVINACGQTLEIPQFGTKHSLNISVSQIVKDLVLSTSNTELSTHLKSQINLIFVPF